jgi:hypothetical protein
MAISNLLPRRPVQASHALPAKDDLLDFLDCTGLPRIIKQRATTRREGDVGVQDQKGFEPINEHSFLRRLEWYDVASVAVTISL